MKEYFRNLCLVLLVVVVAGGSTSVESYQYFEGMKKSSPSSRSNVKMKAVYFYNKEPLLVPRYASSISEVENNPALLRYFSLGDYGQKVRKDYLGWVKKSGEYKALQLAFLALHGGGYLYGGDSGTLIDLLQSLPIGLPSAAEYLMQNPVSVVDDFVTSVINESINEVNQESACLISCFEAGIIIRRDYSIPSDVPVRIIFHRKDVSGKLQSTIKNITLRAENTSAQECSYSDLSISNIATIRATMPYRSQSRVDGGMIDLPGHKWVEIIVSKPLELRCVGQYTVTLSGEVNGEFIRFAQTKIHIGGDEVDESKLSQFSVFDRDAVSRGELKLSSGMYRYSWLLVKWENGRFERVNQGEGSTIPIGNDRNGVYILSGSMVDVVSGVLPIYDRKQVYRFSIIFRFSGYIPYTELLRSDEDGGLRTYCVFQDPFAGEIYRSESCAMPRPPSNVSMH